MASNSTGWLYRNLENSVIRIIQKQELKEEASDCWINESTQIGSYNWNESGGCTIFVPGRARAYNESKQLELKKDNRVQMVDENRDRQPNYPLESLFRAVKLCTPEFSFNEVNFVTDRNNLRKLFNFVVGSADKSFRVDFHKIKNTIAFIRQEEKTKEICNDYGKCFENQFTTFDNISKGSHRRIITYNFADFKMVVRFEVDCIEPELSTAMSKMRIAAKDKTDDSATNYSKKFDNSELSYQVIGDEVLNQDTLMELTTKSIYKGNRDFPRHKWDQLFFSQTHCLVIGWHKFGTLQQVQKYTFKDVSKECGKTKQNTENFLKKLYHLLSTIKSLPNEENKDRVFSIIYDHAADSKVLKVYLCEKKVFGAIPDTLIKEIF